MEQMYLRGLGVVGRRKRDGENDKSVSPFVIFNLKDQVVVIMTTLTERPCTTVLVKETGGICAKDHNEEAIMTADAKQQYSSAPTKDHNLALLRNANAININENRKRCNLTT